MLLLVLRILLKIKKHHRELESIARGNSISNDVIKNDNNLQTIVPLIIAILPEIIKTMPEAANQINKLIDGEGIK